MLASRVLLRMLKGRTAAPVPTSTARMTPTVWLSIWQPRLDRLETYLLRACQERDAHSRGISRTRPP